MLRLIKYMLLCVVWLLAIAYTAKAQSFDYSDVTSSQYPVPAEISVVPLPDDEGGRNYPYSVCPSETPATFSSTTVFTLDVNELPEAGALTGNTYYWAVYGGTITHVNGTAVGSLGGGVLVASDVATDIDGAGKTRSYIVFTGQNTNTVTITVRWDDAQVVWGAGTGAWVASQQTSEWGCSDGRWSFFHVNVTDDAAPIIWQNPASDNIQLAPTPSGAGITDDVLVYVTATDIVGNVAVDFTNFNYGYSNATISFAQPSSGDVNPVSSDEPDAPVNCWDQFSNGVNSTQNASGNYPYGENTITWTAEDALNTTTFDQQLNIYAASEFTVLFNEGSTDLGCNPDFAALLVVPSFEEPVNWEPDPAFGLLGVGYTDVLGAIVDANAVTPDGYHYKRTRTITMHWRHVNNNAATFSRVATQVYTFTQDNVDPTLDPVTTFTLDEALNTEKTLSVTDLYTNEDDNSGVAPTVTIFSFPATAIDNGDGTYTFDCADLEATHRFVLRVTDECNNSQDYNVDVTFEDGENPIATGKTIDAGGYNTNVNDGSGCRFIVQGDEFDLDYAQTTDNCAIKFLRFWIEGATVVGNAGSPVTIQDNDANDANPAAGIVEYSLGPDGYDLEIFSNGDGDNESTIHWIVEDKSGNTATVDYVITIIDDTPPYIAECGTTIHAAYDFGDAANLTSGDFPLPVAIPVDECNDVDNYSYQISAAGTPVELQASGQPLPDFTGVTIAVDMKGLAEEEVYWIAEDSKGKTTGLGCIQTIHVDYKPEVGQIAYTGPTCYGAADGVIQVLTTVVESGTITTYYYSGTDEDGNPVSGNNATGIFTGLVAGTYEVWFEVNVNGYTQISKIYPTDPDYATPDFILTAAAPVFVESDINPEVCPATSDGIIEVFPGPDVAHPLSVNGGSSFTGGDISLNKSYTMATAPAAFTVSAWVKNDGAGATGTIVGFGGTNQYYSLRASGGNALFLVGGTLITAANALNDGKWHLLTGTWDGTARLYIDDNGLAASGVAAMTPALTRFGYIGAESTTDVFDGGTLGGSEFTGKIAQVGIADGVAFDVAAIQAIFDDGLASGAFTDLWSMNVAISSQATALANSKNTDHWGQMNGVTLNTGDAELISHNWWFNGNPLAAADWTKIEDLVSGTYTLRVANNFGCSQDLTFEVVNSNNTLPNIIEPTYTPNNAVREYVFANDATRCYTATTNAMVPGANDTGVANEFPACEVALYYKIDYPDLSTSGWQLQSFYATKALPVGLSASSFVGIQLPVNDDVYTVTWRAVGLAHLGQTTSDLDATMATLEALVAPDDIIDFTDLTYTVKVEDREAPRFVYPGVKGAGDPFSVVLTYVNDPGECFATYFWNSNAVWDNDDIQILTLTDNCTASGDIVVAWEILDEDDAQLDAGTSLADMDPSYQFPVGTSKVTYTFTDLATEPNATSTDINGSDYYTVTVNDADVPTLSVTENAYIGNTDDNNAGDCEYSLQLDAPTFDDNCPIILNWEISYGGSVIASGTFSLDDPDPDPTPWSEARDYGVGETTIRYWLNDGYTGNVEETITVTVTDNEFPEFDIPADIVDHAADADECTAVINGLAISNLVENCPDPVTTFSILLPDGLTTVTTVGASTTDVSGYAFPVGTSTVTYFVTDASGNTTDHSFTVEVVDTEIPVTNPLAAAPTFFLDATGVVTVNATDLVNRAGSSDNCTLAAALTVEVSTDDATWENSFEYGCADLSAPASPQTLYLRVLDASGNPSASIIAQFNIVDNEAPVITTDPATLTNADVAMDDGECFATLPEADLLIEFTDNVSVATCADYFITTWTAVHESNAAWNGSGTGYPDAYEFHVGTTTVTYTVSDGDANGDGTAGDDGHAETDQLSFDITVIDKQQPEIATNAVNDDDDFVDGETYCFTSQNDDQSYALNTSFAITDNCSVASVVVTLAHNDGVAIADPAITINGSNYSFDHNYALGKTTVTWTINDANPANTVTYSYDIIFASEYGFTIDVPDDRDADVYCNPNDDDVDFGIDEFLENVQVVAAPWLLDLIAADPTAASYTVTIDPNGLEPRPAEACNNSRIRTYAAVWSIDLNGTCNLVVNKQGNQTYTYRDDLELPTVTNEAEDLEIQCVEGHDYETDIAAWLALHGNATATDNCPADRGDLVWDNDYVAGSASGGCFGTGEVEVTFTVTDFCGNENTTSAFIRIIDTEVPVLAGIPLDLLDADGNAVDCHLVPDPPGIWNPIGAETPVTATDNCSTDDDIAASGITIDYVEDNEQDLFTEDEVGYYQYTITRTWTATDQCGNVSDPLAPLAIQLIDVEDQTPPVINPLALPGDQEECALDEDQNIDFIDGVLVFNLRNPDDLSEEWVTDNCAPLDYLTIDFLIEKRNATDDGWDIVQAWSPVDVFTGEGPNAYTYNEGRYQVSYRATDVIGLQSALESFEIIVHHKPDLDEVNAIHSSEPTGFGGPADPLRYSTHDYQILMDDKSLYTEISYAEDGTGWVIYEQDGITPVADANYDILASSLDEATDPPRGIAKVTIRFNGTMLPDETDYILRFTEQTDYGCFSVRDFPFTLHAPFDVDIYDMADECSDVSGTIQDPDVDVPTSTYNYTIELIEPTYANNWGFHYDISIVEDGVGNNDASIESVLFTVNNGVIANLNNGNPPTTASGDIAVTYTSGNVTSLINLRVVYRDKPATVQLVTVALTNITGSNSEIDLNFVEDADFGVDDAVGSEADDTDGDDQNSTMHLIQYLPAPTNITGVE
jgi:hypothetical protein